MKRMSFTLLLLLALFTGALAQEMGLSPEFEKVKWMLGEWTGTMKFDMADMGKMEGPTTLSCQMDGQFMKTVNINDMQGMKMIETAYMGWEESLGKFKCWTFANFAPTPRIEVVTLEGDKAVFISEPWVVPGMPGPTLSRATLSKEGTKGLKMVIEFKEGENWTKVGEATFKKKD